MAADAEQRRNNRGRTTKNSLFFMTQTSAGKRGVQYDPEESHVVDIGDLNIRP